MQNIYTLISPYIPAKCKALPATSNGVFNLTTDGATTTATLTCNDGYEVTGTGSVNCQSDGTWSIVGQQTCCEFKYFLQN